MFNRIERLGRVARLQYTLMILLGSTCLLAALAPITYEVKIAAVAVTFGITAGIWISHLITVVVPQSTSMAVEE